MIKITGIFSNIANLVSDFVLKKEGRHYTTICTIPFGGTTKEPEDRTYIKLPRKQA